MQDQILKIHTQNGDIPIGYSGLADKPIADKTLSEEGAFADSKAVGDKFKEVKTETDSLKEDLSNKITKFYASSQGEPHLADSDNGKIQDMMIYAKSSQDLTPTPENPVEIKSVVNPTVKVCGKNLFTFSNDSRDINGVIFEAKDGIITAKGTSTKEFTSTYFQFNYPKDIFTIGETYTFSLNSNDANLCLIALYKENDMVDYRRLFEATTKCATVKIPDNVDLIIRCVVDINATVNATATIQIEKGSTATSYEPYHKYTVTLPYTLNAIPVSSGGNVTIDGQQYVADYVDVEREKLVRMVDSSKLDNTQSIVDKTEWLLAEPQEIDLTTEEITAFKELSTYYPTTHISVTSEQLDGYTVFNYPISMANGWNYVKKQLNDNRDYIYDMDIQSAEAYVNSEYAVALTELEV